MEAGVPPLQLAHLVLEGAVMAFCMELAVRTIFFPHNQKSWLIRGLKITMALSMVIKSSIFSAFSSTSLENYCQLAGRITDIFYHISCLSAICILLLRVKVVVPSHKQTLFHIIHAFILISRFIVSVVDIIYAHIWRDIYIGVCRYKDRHEIGITYTLYDTIIDIYVSIVTTYILLSHIRKLHAGHVNGNVTLYRSVVISNVIRTILLSIVNLVCTVYYIIANGDPAVVLIAWPISNMFLIVLIGYDTNITNFIQQCQKILSATTQNDDSLALLNKEPTLPQQQQKQQQNQQQIVSVSSVSNEPVVATPFADKDVPFISRRLSNMSILEVDDETGPSKREGSSSLNDANNSSSCTIVNIDNHQNQNN